MKNGTKSVFGLSDTLGGDADAHLVSAAAGGDLDAFEQLVCRHQHRIYNFVLRMTDSREDAAEVTQDVFVAAFRHLKTFRGKSKFATWLGAIAANLSRNRLAQNRRRRANETPSLDASFAADEDCRREPAAAGPSVLERLEARALRRAVRECIARLPIEFREVVVLRDLQELAYDEIAGVLSLRTGTVKSRLSRAREAVKRCLRRTMEIWE